MQTNQLPTTWPDNSKKPHADKVAAIKKTCEAVRRRGNFAEQHPVAYSAGFQAWRDFKDSKASRFDAFDRINLQLTYGAQAAFVDGWTDACEQGGVQ